MLAKGLFYQTFATCMVTISNKFHKCTRIQTVARIADRTASQQTI